MPFILALDQGTTSSRATVVDERGAIVAYDQREFPQIFPRPGWVEHDPREIWSSQLETARGAIRNAGLSASDIAAVGITNQRETTVLWERASGAPVANAIVWQDRRTAERCERLRARGAADFIVERTGLLLDPYFSGTKIAWLLDETPGLRARAEAGELAFGTVDSWVMWNLTGGRRHVTDVTNASRTMLFDIHRLRWSDALCELLEVPPSVLPEVLPCTADFGRCSSEWFGGEIPISGVAGDQQAALVGQGGFAEGMAKNTYGTGSFVVLNTGERSVRSRSGLLSTVAFAFERDRATYALEGSIFATGATVQWLRDGLGLFERSSDVERLALEVGDTGDCYFVPAFAGLGAPYWDPHARAALVGITRGTTKAHVARAALEAMAYQTADVIEAMARDSGVDLRELRVDGGASANDLTMQFQSDVLGVPVSRPQQLEATALGAAYLAGLGIGYWESLEAVSLHRREARRFAPSSLALASGGRTKPRLGGRLTARASVEMLAERASSTMDRSAARVRPGGNHVPPAPHPPPHSCRDDRPRGIRRRRIDRKARASVRRASSALARVESNQSRGNVGARLRV